jgi:hypothetical protein
MPAVKNLSYGSLAIQLSDNKQLKLGPRETNEISADEFESEGIQKSLREGRIAVLPGGTPAEKKAKPKPNSN